MGELAFGFSTSLLVQQAELDPTLPELLKENITLIPRRLHKYLIDRNRITADSFRVSITDYEELFQECLIAMWVAADHYNNVLGVPYINYANRSISNVLNDLRDRKHAITMFDTLMTDLIGDRDVDCLQVIDEQESGVYDGVDNTLLMLDFAKVLTTAESSVLHLMICEFNGSEIAKHLNKSQQTISQTVARIRTKFIDYCVISGCEQLISKVEELSVCS